jgi:hypothetical protein
MAPQTPAIVVATLTGLVLAGCQQIEDAGRYLGDQAGVAGRYVGQQLGAATTAVSRWASGRPPDDQTACYATERVAFYDAVSKVKTAESLVFGAALAGLIGPRVTTYSSSFATRMVSTGFAATMAAFMQEIAADHARIEGVTSTFNALMACRRREAAMLKADVAAGRIPRSDGQETMARLRSLVEEDVAVAREINGTLQERTTEFQLSAEKAKEEVAKAPTPKEKREQAQEVQKAEAAVQTNQQAVSQQSASIEQASALPQSDTFELSLLENRYRPGPPMAAA